jgi:hypothetical protein
MPLLRAENMRQVSLCFISQQQFEFHPRYYIKCSHLFKGGGLNSQDQSRLRSRCLDLLRPTFETCRDYPYCLDNIFFLSVEIFKIETFPVETWSCQDFCQDCQDLLRQI